MNSKSEAAKVLIVVTSHNQLGNTGKLTGYYLPEVTHPVHALLLKGFNYDVASIKGGKAPIDAKSLGLDDPINRKFMEDHEFRQKLENTIALDSVNPKNYNAIFFAGGHGTMFDFRDNYDINRITAEIFEAGGVVAAVCHGPAALTDVRLKSGKYLVDGKKIAAFSNAEEDAAGLTQVMPFLLESTLKERGAIYSKAPPWKSHVVIDGRLITGQNPASAAEVGTAVVNMLTRQS